MPVSGKPGQIDPAAIAARCAAPVEDLRGIRSPQEEHLNFGPRWRVLHRMALGQGEGIASLTLPLSAQAADLSQGWLMHPALLDLATGWAMGLILGYHPDHPLGSGLLRPHPGMAGLARPRGQLGAQCRGQPWRRTRCRL